MNSQTILKRLADLEHDSSVDLRNTTVGTKKISMLLKNTNLTSLNLRDANLIEHPSAQRLAQITTLTSLNLRGCCIYPQPVKELAKNPSITSLNLRRNYVGSEGALALAQNTTLTKLDLSHNYILDDGAKALALNSHLLKLKLEGNKIGNEGVIKLAGNKTLTYLDICFNQPDIRMQPFLKTTLIHLKFTISGETNKLLVVQLKKNIRALRQRQRDFLHTLILFATIRCFNSASLLLRLPKDLHIFILNLVIDDLQMQRSLNQSKDKMRGAINLFFCKLTSQQSKDIVSQATATKQKIVVAVSKDGKDRSISLRPK